MCAKGKALGLAMLLALLGCGSKPEQQVQIDNSDLYVTRPEGLILQSDMVAMKAELVNRIIDLEQRCKILKTQVEYLESKVAPELAQGASK